MNNLKSLFFTFVLGMFALTANAQKVGYINASEIIGQLPEVKEANANIETLKKQIKKKGQDMIAGLQKKYEALQTKQQAGQISRNELENEAKKLQEEEAQIVKFEQESQKKVLDKSQQLLAPIQNKINDAIKAVAAEEGYDYIFDASMGIVLYADPTSDVSTSVKAKLGI